MRKLSAYLLAALLAATPVLMPTTVFARDKATTDHQTHSKKDSGQATGTGGTPSGPAIDTGGGGTTTSGSTTGGTGTGPSIDTGGY